MIASFQLDGQDVHQRRQHEHDRDERGDPAGRVADDRAEAEREQADHGEEAARRRSPPGRRRAARTRSGGCGAARGSPGSRRSAIRTAGSIRANDDRARTRPPSPTSTGSRRGTAVKRRADHPGRVLAGDHEHAEHADRELGEVDAGERDLERMAAWSARSCALRCDHGGEARGEERAGADRQHGGDDQRPARRAQRAQLRPLREATRACVTRPVRSRRRQRSRRGAATLTRLLHAGAAAWNSTSSRVSSMNASSSEACCGVSSCRTTPLARARARRPARRRAPAPRARRSRPRGRSRPGR